jgi:type III secretory pathway component EscT
MNETLIFMGIVLVSIVVFDVYIIAKKGKAESISAHLIRMSHKHPSIPFLIGFVAGHLFWSFNSLDAVGGSIFFK